MDDIEYANTIGKDKLSRMIDNLNEEQLIELLSRMSYITDSDAFNGDYAEALINEFMMGFGDEYNGFSEFYYDLQDIVCELFEMSFDDEGNLIE